MNQISPIPEKQLIAAAIAGNRLALRQIIDHTQKLVLHIVHSMVTGKEDREDLAQDVYLKAFKSLQNFRQEAKLSTWIARITYNTCLNHLEKKRLNLLDIEDVGELHEPSSDGDAFELLEKKQVAGVLRDAIDQLPTLYKTLITLYHFSFFNLAEISQVTGLPEGTIKSYLYRARKALLQTVLVNYKSKEVL